MSELAIYNGNNHIEPRQLGLVPRGPRWMYVTWDWSVEDLSILARKFGASAVQLLCYNPEGDRKNDVLFDLHAKSTGWYVPVSNQNNLLVIELGVFNPNDKNQWICFGRGSWGYSYSSKNINSVPGHPNVSRSDFPHSVPVAENARNGLTEEPVEEFINLSSSQASQSHQKSLTRDASQSGFASSDFVQNETFLPDPKISDKSESKIGATSLDFAFYGTVEVGSKVFFLGKEVPVLNGNYSFRVRQSMESQNIEIAIVSPDGSKKCVRQFRIKAQIEERNLPEISNLKSTEFHER